MKRTDVPRAGDLNCARQRNLSTTRFVTLGGLFVLVLSASAAAVDGGALFEMANRPVGLVSAAVAVADLNADGRPDAVVANAESDDVSVLLSVDGLLGAATHYATGDAPVSLALGDVDGVGGPDIVVANRFAATIVFLPNLGDGTFGSPQTVFAGSSFVWNLALADLNADGALDIVASVDGDLVVLSGNGDGTFVQAQSIEALSGISKIALGDLDGDGVPDLVRAGAGLFSSIRISLGEGDATFGPTLEIQTDWTIDDIEIGDIDGDGVPDLVTGGVLMVFLGAGDGTFSPPLVTSGHGETVCLGDLDGDGGLDLVAGKDSGGTMTALHGVGDGTFEVLQTFSGGILPTDVTLADLDGDGARDMLFASRDGFLSATEESSLTVVLGRGDGTFETTAPPLVPGMFGSVEVAADLDADGHQDVVIQTFDSILVSRGLGDGVYAQPLVLPTAPYMEQVIAADLNGDSVLDLAAVRADLLDEVSVFLGVGDGTFGPEATYSGHPSPESIGVGEFDGDGFVDLVLAVDARVVILPGLGDGTFGVAAAFGSGQGQPSLAVGDLDGDRNDDVVVSNFDSNDVVVLLGHGDGSFDPPVPYAVGTDPVALALGDLNGDGHLDAAVANNGSADVSVLLGLGDGTFGPSSEHASAQDPLSIAIGDLDGDGALDIASGGGSADKVSVLIGNGTGGFAPTVNHHREGITRNVLILDLDEDGAVDMLTTDIAGPSPLYNRSTRPWCGRFGELAGTAAAPLLHGAGTLQDGAPGLMTLHGALPASLAFLVVGFSEIGAPFKGGTLVPSPEFIIYNLPTGAGVLPIPFVFPSGVPSGVQFAVQAWVSDPGGPLGFSASNGLVASVP